ncbi:MAG: hypothetical protein ACREUG_03250, partial [Steroidobacteraceae bacterium]
LMLIAHAEGLHPAIAARDYHIIQGRPALKADAMLARFHVQGGRVEWLEYTDKRVAATFSHPQGGTVEVDWTMDRARQAGLAGKDTWKAYPRQMLRARVVSEGIRTVFPGVVVGVYTPDEVQDFEPAEVKDVTPRRASASASTDAAVVDAEFDDSSKIPYEAPAPKGFTDSQRADHLAAIEDAVDIDSLKTAYARAYTAAMKVGDGEAVTAFTAAKDACKSALSAPAATSAAQTEVAA